MAEDNGDKTEAPTPRRRQEALEQGNVARSQDLSAAVLIISVMMLLNWYGPGLVSALKAIVQEMLIARTSERQGRAIDKDEAGSMEKKKREGYF